MAVDYCEFNQLVTLVIAVAQGAVVLLEQINTSGNLIHGCCSGRCFCFSLYLSEAIFGGGLSSFIM